MMERNWSPMMRLSNTPETTVEQTKERVLQMPRSSAWVMLLSMPLATMHEPKHMAQRMSQIVSSMPAIPRVATSWLMATSRERTGYSWYIDFSGDERLDYDKVIENMKVCYTERLTNMNTAISNLE